ncbi:MAG: hypothetical protein JSU86_06695, partial [Phycisphaerales bacterium]
MVSDAKRIAAPLLVVPLLLTAPAGAQKHVIDLKFEKPPATGSDETRSLQSLKKIQGTGQFCQDGLYLMTHYGDREALFEAENQKVIDEPLLKQTWRHCSLFSAAGNDSVIMGRNWDNQTVGSIIVNLYYPPNGYASISVTRSIDVGFMQKDLQDYVSMPWGRQLLLSPFWAFDGINEHGLAAGVAGVKEVVVKPMPGK